MFFMLRPLLYRLLLRGLPEMSHPHRARPPQTALERRRLSPPETSRAPPEPTGGSSPRSADPAGGPPRARAGSALLPPRKRRSANGFRSIRSAAGRGGSSDRAVRSKPGGPRSAPGRNEPDERPTRDVIGAAPRPFGRTTRCPRRNFVASAPPPGG